jgi:ABC-type Fe3+/spermidine/putrescine transport system ATPase subunit
MGGLIHCRGLVCRLGGHLVLSGAELDVAPRQSLALLGSSGSGKSTLLRVIAGLEIPEAGEVLIAGLPATRNGRLLIAPHRRGVAMLFQDLALWPNLSVSGNVCLGLSGLRLPRGQRRDRAGQAMKMCGIEDLSRRLPGTLSGGQQQRVALARALAVQPRLLLLDEPFGGLDLVTKEAIIRELVRLRAKLGFALILVTHDPLEVRQLCDSLAVLEAGRIAEQGPLEHIARRPQTALAKALMRQLAGRA